MTHFRQNKRSGALFPAAGFTLMELMAVVGIIVLMASVAVGGFAGIQRAMGTSTGADRFRRALNAARQQACVDGTDVFVWCTDVDKFIICRKGGTVNGRETSKRSLDTKYSSDKIEAYWVCDEFADLDQDASSSYVNPSDLVDKGGKNRQIGVLVKPGDGTRVTVKARDLAQFFERQFSDSLVFDVTARKVGKCSYPPFYQVDNDGKYEGWMFGIKAEDYESGSFKVGSEYAWPLMPVQSLPGGFVFDGSWNNNSGDFDTGWMQDAYVQFYPDGRAKCGRSQGFTITEAGAAKPIVQRVRIDANGQITVSRK